MTTIQDEIKTSLFSYGTSELSQDAFICWLLSWTNADNKPDRQRCAKNFITLLYGLFKGDVESETKIGKLICLKRQYQKIDVYFQAEVNGKVVSFVLEDKIDTSYHSQQLERYRHFLFQCLVHEFSSIQNLPDSCFVFDSNSRVEVSLMEDQLWRWILPYYIRN